MAVRVLYFPGAETPGADPPRRRATDPRPVDSGSHPGDVGSRDGPHLPAGAGAHGGSDRSRHGVGELVGIQATSYPVPRP